MKTMFLIGALSALSASQAYARELNESFQLRQEARQEAELEEVVNHEAAVPEAPVQTCHEEKQSCDKC